MTTSCTKKIWLVVFEDSRTEYRHQRVAASNFNEVVAYFNEEGIKKIVEIKRLNEDITYHY